ncbi:MAG: DUF3553 domain-containing protein [Nitrospirae bacterium]|nr:DUF3553 domain-containing protein [Nitrospirota bacterium]MBF0536444.1 DUF3553 domain-containing protein [Nitrospirota bacterium]MBF0618345.1 DUF3553 domain-containing protein [Nitrospirota bacterium]
MFEHLSFDKLNSKQGEAIEHMESPIIVLAGAGSGKTQLITHKYSHLYKKDKSKYENMLAIAFSIKAASEMKSRISYIISEDLEDAWIGTFYSQCSRILRQEGAKVSVNNDFIIYDNDDQSRLIRHILSEMKLYEALYKGVLSKISCFKSSLVMPDDLLSSSSSFDFDEKIIKVYVRYQDEMEKSGALDQDDLIIYTIKLFEENPDILEKYTDLFNYILVDEFQDSNYSQYYLLKILSEKNRNILVAGDDDQSTYKYKGLESENVLSRFEKDFPDAMSINLEQAYRFTRNILDVSHSIIAKNRNRKTKPLWTDKAAGEKVCHYWFISEEDEAKYIAKNIKDLYLKGTYVYGDIAILYRVPLQSRVIEEALKDERIPFRVFGCTNFYQKKEIKDVISYLRLIINSYDNVSIRRIINLPARSISANTISKLEQEAKKEGVSLYVAMQNVCNNKGLTVQVKEKLKSFVSLLDTLSSSDVKTVSDGIKLIGTLTGYIEILDENELSEITELMFANGNMPIREFLDMVAISTTNTCDASNTNAITLTTLHNVKGMEFPVVFITGLEDGLIPYFKATGTEDELDEERRLFYLGMTRAKDVLFMTGARRRRLYAKFQEQEPSRFLKDIPKDCCLWLEKNAIPTNSSARSQEGKKEPVVFPYNSGCRVKHPKWGVGVVRDCYGEDDDVKVTVNFPNVGIKRLALKFANLEKI